ncbi:MAG: helix-turn-helix domain-containing protein [Patescibacteria group bacterium]|mgnify:CR=1 FL=1
MVEEIKPTKIYTPKEARDFLKISESTMKRMIKNGIIKAYKVSGQYRIWGDEILRLISPDFEKGFYKMYKKVKDKTIDTITKW